MPYFSTYALNYQIASLTAIMSKNQLAILQEFKMSQSQVDALTQAVTTMNTNLTAADAAIRAEIAKLQAVNPALDLTALTTAVGALGTVATDVDAIPPATAPTGP